MTEFVTAIGAGPAHLVRHSRGARICFRVAQRHPHVVRRLVLAEPSGVLDDTLARPDARRVSSTVFIANAVEQVRSGDVEGGLRSFFGYAVGPGAWDKLPEARKTIHRDNALTLLGQINEGLVPYSRASAERISAPTLLIGGALTRPTYTTVLDGLDDGIHAARRVTIPDAGHPMNRDNPSAFSKAVIDFLHAT